MASYWERVGEAVGYSLAVVLIGPVAALQRQARRRMVYAAIGFCRRHAPIELAAPKGVVRRAIRLATPGGPIPVEMELRPFEGSASLVVTIPALPGNVHATVRRHPSGLRGARDRRTEALAEDGSVRIEAATLDVETARALVAAISAGPLGALPSFELEIRREQLDLVVAPPATTEAWVAIGEGIVLLVAWLTARWPSSYRG
jgi:hypothetical protein